MQCSLSQCVSAKGSGVTCKVRAWSINSLPCCITSQPAFTGQVLLMFYKLHNLNFLVAFLAALQADHQKMKPNCSKRSSIHDIYSFVANIIARRYFSLLLSHVAVPYSGKLSWEKSFMNWGKILRVSSPQRKISQIVRWCCQIMLCPQILQGKLSSHKTSKFGKVFSLESFPLYSTYQLIGQLTRTGTSYQICWTFST